MSSGKRTPALIALSHVQLDTAGEQTLRRSLYLCVRNAVLDGSLTPGARLPSTRQLAAELNVSRNTVADAFDQLVAEGLLVARHGSGTFVSATEIRRVLARRAATCWDLASRRGRLLASRSPEDDLSGRRAVPFQPGIPAFEHFPFQTWARIAAHVLRNPKPDMLGYGHSGGYGPLRDVVAAEIRARGGQVCREDQVVIVGGTSQALDLVARVTLDPGDEVWLEEPSSLYVRATLASAGARLVPVPVDGDGIDVTQGIERSPQAKLAHVTSAHQWPLGATLSDARREQLLEWSRHANAWIVEDEYDGVFRYDGRRPRPLRALDRHDRVIAVGSFSVTTFPALRLGYIVAPPALAGAFIAAKAVAGRQESLFEQAVLAEFIYDGHYTKHRKRMEAMYERRRHTVIERIADAGGPLIEAGGSGLHVVLPLDPDADDVAASRAAREIGILAPPLSAHYLTDGVRKGLVLGFGAGSIAGLEMSATALCRDVLRFAASGAALPRERRLRTIAGPL